MKQVICFICIACLPFLFNSNAISREQKVTEGTLSWSYTTGNYVESCPAIGSDGKIYVGSGNNGLYAITSAGVLSWIYAAGSYISSSPAIGSDGTIYVGSGDSKIYAVNSTGTLKWSYTTGDVIWSSPAIGSDGTIYVGSNDKKLYAINSTGTLKWSYTTGGYVESCPAIGSDGMIYAGSDDKKLYAINSDGTLKWSYSTGDTVISSPAIGSDGTIYMGSFDKKLYALNPDGTLKWSYTTGGIIGTCPAIGSDGTIYIASNDSALYAMNPAGTLKWSYTAGNKFISTPAIGSDGTIYIGSNDKKLYAINSTGTLKWSYTTGGIVRSSPAIGSDGTIYVGSYDNKLYALTSSSTGGLASSSWPMFVHDNQHTGNSVNSILPVELISFSATIGVDNIVKLNWGTSSETNNLGFTVERSTDKKVWEKAGFIDGNGTSMVEHVYSYQDKNLHAGTYYYRLAQTDFDGTINYSEIVTVTIALPKEFSLQQNYPNPFNPTTTIIYNLPQTSNVKLTIYNLLGQAVKVLISDVKPAGSYVVQWDGKNSTGLQLPSGIYVYRMQAGNFTKNRKMILMK